MSQNNHSPLLPFTSRRRFYVLLLLLLVLVIVVAGFYFQQSSTLPDGKSVPGKGMHGFEEADAASAVSIETVTQADFPVYLKGLGTVTALRTVIVKPRVDGELVRIAFTEGQMVKQGDLLAEIDPRPFQIQLQQVEGQMLRDEALLKNAQIDHARYLTLLEQDSIAAQQTVTQEAQVKQYQGLVTMDKAQVDNAKLQLSYTRLTSPIPGRVGLRQIDQGNIVHANDANGLVVITQLQPISVVFTLPEDQVQLVTRRWRSNEPVIVEVYDRAGKTQLAVGKLLAIDNQIDPTTGTLKLKGQFDNNEGTLFVNQFVNVKMNLETLHDAVLVSSAAIQHDTQGAFIYVVKPDKTIQIRRVTLGATEAEKVVVLSNLSANEKVVIEGTDRLHEGSRVDITQQDGQAVAASSDTLTNPDAKLPKRDQR
jgi:multidrug efflux system membrane fusion protein